MKVFLLTLIFGTSLVLCSILENSEINSKSGLESPKFPENRGNVRAARTIKGKLTPDDISKFSFKYAHTLSTATDEKRAARLLRYRISTEAYFDADKAPKRKIDVYF